MKLFLLIPAWLILFIGISCTNKQNLSLDGKTFQISCWDINQPDKTDPDVLIFKNGTMDSEACHQYGFTAAPYNSKSSNEHIQFTSTISSPTEGEMIFEGLVNDKDIEGTFLWKKNGQADISYKFKGNLKN